MQQTTSFPFLGGLDLVTPAISIPPGRAIAGVNYEPHPRGYRRFQGFERFDGRQAPSSASYVILRFENGTAAMTAGQTVTGATSLTARVLLFDAVVESGTYGGGNAAGYLVLVAPAGSGGDYTDGENLQVAAVTKATADGTDAERAADDDVNDELWLTEAQEYYRALIQAVPGSGPVRGVWRFDGDVYAIRTNAGDTADVMHVATAAGWSAVDLGLELAFTSGGTYVIAAGNTITGATSAATATVSRVIVTSGSFGAGTAAGRLILVGGSQTGNFVAENLNVGANLNVATIAANSSQITLTKGGVYEFLNHNFYGASNLYRMYFAGGVGKAVEFDGTVGTPITTGMVTDAPLHITAHKQHLFLSFDGGSIQYSPIGDPTATWTVVLGAGEIAIGEEVTGMLSAAGAGVMTIFGQNKVANLYGSSSIDWDLVVLAEDAGGREFTAQLIGTPVYQDSRGVRSLNTTAAFGDFKLGTLTDLVEPIFRSREQDSQAAVCSLRVRAKDQYRLFWNDGTGVVIYFGRKKPEAMVFDYGEDILAFCACSVSDLGYGAGQEYLYIGAEDGFVYQLDSGNSYDGEAVNAYIRMPFVNIGAPQVEKRWTKVSLETDTSPDTELTLICDFDYADTEQAPSLEQQFTVHGGGGFWDEVSWDEFIWSSPVNGTADCHISGIGKNMSLTVISSDITREPHTLQGVTFHYSPRRLRR